MILNVFSYSIKIEKNMSNKEILRKKIEQKNINEIYEKIQNQNDNFFIR